MSDRKHRPSLQLGQEVEWATQAGGNYRSHRGEVVGIVPRGEYPAPEFAGGVRMYGPFDPLGEPLSFPRDHESYVVEVRYRGRNGQQLKPRYYWPVVSKLREVKRG